MRKHQLNALLRKSLVYQKKNWGQNCCVLVSPVVLIALLGIMQTLIDQLLDRDEAKVCSTCIRFTANSGRSA